MTTPHEAPEAAAAQRSAVIPADPVLDAELIDDNDRPHTRQERYRRPSWWQRSPRVPTAFKSRAHTAQAAKDTAVTTVRSLWRFLRAASRGTVLATRAWRRWVTVRDYREAAEQSEKLADKYVEIRELTLLRWRVTGGVTGIAMTAMAVVDMVYGSRALWITAVIGAVSAYDLTYRAVYGLMCRGCGVL
jgi:S-DNA-T family DNA segregation ATPase FtsK/SpoIIIE